MTKGKQNRYAARHHTLLFLLPHKTRVDNMRLRGISGEYMRVRSLAGARQAQSIPRVDRANGVSSAWSGRPMPDQDLKSRGRGGGVVVRITRSLDTHALI